MRRVISIILVVTGLFTAVTGIWNFFPPISLTFSPGHAVGACIFGILCVIHVWLNWKSILKYFRGLRWWWLPIALGFVAVVMVSIVPLLRG